MLDCEEDLAPLLTRCIGSSNDRLTFWAAFLRATDSRAVAELGVWKGEFAAGLLSRCPVIDCYYMVDPWQHLDQWNKPWNKSDIEFEAVYQAAIENTSAHAAKTIIARGETADAIDTIPDTSLDFAYIDGDHTLRGITIDLTCVYPKVKPGAYIGGDDFSPSIWQHGKAFEPSLVCPYAVYFAEAMRAEITLLPRQQFVIRKPATKSSVFRLQNMSGAPYQPELRSYM